MNISSVKKVKRNQKQNKNIGLSDWMGVVDRLLCEIIWPSFY